MYLVLTTVYHYLPACLRSPNAVHTPAAKRFDAGANVYDFKSLLYLYYNYQYDFFVELLHIGSCSRDLEIIHTWNNIGLLATS